MMWHLFCHTQFIIICVLLLQRARSTSTATNLQHPNCGRYRGIVCKDYLEANARVVIPSNSTYHVDQQLSRAFTEVLDHEDILENCADNAKALLCHWVYPTCNDDNRTLPLCNDSVCTDIRTVSCSRDWTTLESRITAMGYFNVSDYSCDTERALERPCTKVGFHDTCFVGNGISYRGNINVTAEGDPCQAWESQIPYQHDDTPDKYPSLAGHNYCRNPDDSRAVPLCHPRTVSANTDFNEVCGIPRCRNDPLYTPGSCFAVDPTWHCSQFLDSTREIFAESKDFLTEADRELNILFNVLLTNPGITATSKCLKIFEELMCHYFFPYCSLYPGFPVPIKVCQENCDIVRNVSCQFEYTLALNWFDATGFKTISVPDCNSLPEIQFGRRLGDQGCFELGYSSDAHASVTYDCIHVNSRGVSYRGTQNTSRSGTTCLFWNDIYPRSTTFNPDVYPELRGHNYCRNPQGYDHFGPFCFIIEKKRIVRDLCKIPDCRDKNVKKPDIAPGEDSSFPLTIVLAVSVPCGIIALLSIAILTVFIYRKRNKSKDRNYPNLQSPNLSELNPLYVLMELQSLNLPKDLDIPRENLTFFEELGEGHFGKVMRAEAVNISGKDGTTTVAVKTLREKTSAESYKEFAKEVKIMMDFDHPHIVKLLGVCSHTEELCMIFEYMAKGDLNQLLRSASPDIIISDKQSQTISVSEMILTAEHIASGMVYLSQKHYVHRDLATRNCLVSENNTVKLADFGLTRDIYSDDYYRVGGKKALPIRWMPPESIVYGKFTVSSDVWSFGIVLWEIFTFGKQPFYGMTNKQVVELAAQKKAKLSPPPTCPFAIGNLMLQCCHTNAKKRPSFEEIHTSLVEMQHQQKQLN